MEKPCNAFNNSARIQDPGRYVDDRKEEDL